MLTGAFTATPYSQCSYKCTISLILITNICFREHIVAANWSPCRRQTLRPAASWSQPAGSSNSVPTSCLSHTSTHSPSCQPAVHTWQMPRRLAKEDLYLVFDLLEFASILVKEKGLVVVERKVTEIPVFPLMHQDDGTG